MSISGSVSNLIDSYRAHNSSDHTHCVHGTFVGDPYGPDYMCGKCEEGWSCGHSRLVPWCATCRSIDPDAPIGWWLSSLLPVRVKLHRPILTRKILFLAVTVNRRQYVWCLTRKGIATWAGRV